MSQTFISILCTMNSQTFRSASSGPVEPFSRASFAEWIARRDRYARGGCWGERYVIRAYSMWRQTPDASVSNSRDRWHPRKTIFDCAISQTAPTRPLTL
ncbi:MAG: hypothetical protein V1899_01185 [Planctomycetota bacterium]